MNFIGPSSIEGLLETHPWLRDVILQEYIRVHLDVKGGNGIALARTLYARRMPPLEREALLNVNRYGVPYNPILPPLSRTSVNVKQVLWWLLGLPE